VVDDVLLLSVAAELLFFLLPSCFVESNLDWFVVVKMMMMVLLPERLWRKPWGSHFVEVAVAAVAVAVAVAAAVAVVAAVVVEVVAHQDNSRMVVVLLLLLLLHHLRHRKCQRNKENNKGQNFPRKKRHTPT